MFNNLTNPRFVVPAIIVALLVTMAVNQNWFGVGDLVSGKSA